MPLYVTVSEGSDPAEARALLVVDDAGVAQDVARLIAKRLGVSLPAARAATRTTVVVPLTKPGGDR